MPRYLSGIYRSAFIYEDSVCEITFTYSIECFLESSDTQFRLHRTEARLNPYLMELHGI